MSYHNTITWNHARAIPRPVRYNGSDAILPGIGMCYDFEYTETGDGYALTDPFKGRDAIVKKAKPGINHRFAGVSDQYYPPSSSGSQMITIYQPGSVCPIAILDEATIGDVVTCVASDFNATAGWFGPGGFMGRGTASILQTAGAPADVQPGTPGYISYDPDDPDGYEFTFTPMGDPEDWELDPGNYVPWAPLYDPGSPPEGIDPLIHDPGVLPWDFYGEDPGRSENVLSKISLGVFGLGHGGLDGDIVSGDYLSWTMFLKGQVPMALAYLHDGMESCCIDFVGANGTPMIGGKTWVMSHAPDTPRSYTMESGLWGRMRKQFSLYTDMQNDYYNIVSTAGPNYNIYDHEGTVVPSSKLASAGDTLMLEWVQTGSDSGFWVQKARLIA